MAETKRTTAQIEHDSVLIAQMYRQGSYHEDIKNAINARYKSENINITLTRQQISYDIQKLIQSWKESSLLDIDEIKQSELEKINIIEAEMWEAWYKSKKKKEVTREKEGYNSKGDLYEHVTETHPQIGDTKYIDKIQWCIETRLKLVGVSLAEKDKEEEDLNNDEDEIDVEIDIPDNGRDPDSKYV